MKSRQLPTISNAYGLSIMEGVIAMAIMGILMSALGVVMNSVNSLRRSNDIRTTISDISNNTEMFIKLPTSWDFTVQSSENPDLDCLLDDQTNCASESAATNYEPLVLYDESNNIYFDGRRNNNEGFTMDGQPCTGFDGVNGNNNCPISIDLEYKLQCEDPAICLKAVTHVRATFEYSPEPDSALDQSINLGRFNVDIIKDFEVPRQERLVVTYEKDNPPGGPNQQKGEGSCYPGGYWAAKRQLNTVTETPSGANNVTLDTTNDTFELVAGKYRCEISAPAYGVGVHYIGLRSVGGAPVGWRYGTHANSGNISTGTPPATTTRSVLHTELNLGSNSTLSVEHVCENSYDDNNGSLTNAESWELGRPARKQNSNWEDLIFTEIECWRVQ